jgi:Ca2+-binding RTX toxin-like protein
MTGRLSSGILGARTGANVATMRLGLAAMLCGVPLVACSPGSPTSESESKKATTTTSVPVPTRVSDRPSDVAPPPWADDRDLRVRAGGYKGKKCFGDVPTLVGTPGDDRIRARFGDDVIVSLGGNDVIVGPKGAESWGGLYCTGTGADQVSYYEGNHTTRSSYGTKFSIDLGPGDDRGTVFSGPTSRWQREIIRAGRGDDTIIFGPNSSAHVNPGPGDDLIRSPASPGRRRTPCIDMGSGPGRVQIHLARGRATGQGHDRFSRNIRCAVGGRFDDVLLGTPGNDELDPGYGADLVRAGAGDDDVLNGWIYYLPARGEGGDRIHLGPGDDWGDGGPGADRLYGGPGSDSLAGGPGGDYLDGGPGHDDLAAGSGCISTKEGEPPPFVGEACWDDAPNEVFGRSGNDLLSGDLGNDRLDGGLGFDRGSGGYHDGRIDWITSVERLRE